MITGDFDQILNLFKLDSLNTDLIETKEYIKSILIKYIKCDLKAFNDNYSLKYIDAITTHQFSLFQDLGDELLFINSIFPENIKTSREYYKDLGKMSYFKCYKLMNKKWPLYLELADKFDYISESINIDQSFVVKPG